MSFATGSWKRTMPTASSAKIAPTSRSLTCVTFFPNAGSNSIISEIADAMNAAFSAVYARNVRLRATARQLPPARSGWSSGVRTRRSTSAYATNVAQLTTNRIVNVDGCATEATSPAVSPPTAAPRFIVRRCSAYAGERRAGGVRPARSADCDGQNEPLPMPQTT